MTSVTDFITNLGAAVVLPVLIFIFAIILGQRPGRAFRSALLIGIGFVGIGLVITLLIEQLGPAAEGMAERLQVDLNVIDVGWPSTSAIAFGSQVGAFVIPIGLAVNIVLLAIGLTRTLDIDLWNYWHIAFSGALVALVTDSIFWGFAAAAIHMVILLALADWSAPWIQEYYNFPGISLPHGTSAPYVFLAIPLNWVFDRIPRVRDWKADPEAIQRRFGIFGESIILGLVLGILLGILGGLPVTGILQLGINLAAVMLLLPRMVAILMEGLIPISEAAREFVQRRFPGRNLYIGLDSAIAVGAPAVIATALLMVPITLLIAVILPGNRVLPFGDLATMPFIVCMMVPIFRGNIFRSVVAGAIAIAGGLYIATWISPTFTQAARNVNFEAPGNATQLSSLVDGANPLTGVFYGVAQAPVIGLPLLAVAALLFAWWVSRRKPEEPATPEGEPRPEEPERADEPRVPTGAASRPDDPGTR
jgi:PTS system galactitol-specific IIC component